MFPVMFQLEYSLFAKVLINGWEGGKIEIFGVCLYLRTNNINWILCFLTDLKNEFNLYVYTSIFVPDYLVFGWTDGGSPFFKVLISCIVYVGIQIIMMLYWDGWKPVTLSIR